MEKIAGNSLNLNCELICKHLNIQFFNYSKTQYILSDIKPKKVSLQALQVIVAGIQITQKTLGRRDYQSE